MKGILAVTCVVGFSAGCSWDGSLKLTPPNRVDDVIVIKDVSASDAGSILIEMRKGDAERNTELLRLLANSDIQCGKFISHLYGRRAVTNVWYGGITSATAAAAAIVGGRAAQNLAGMSAVTNQARTSINSEIYGGELVTSVAKEILTLRGTKRTAIMKGATQSISKYPPEQAVSDVVYYHELCSIPVAMGSILNRADRSSEERVLDVDGPLARLEDAIAKNKALLVDASISAGQAQKDALSKRILDLSEQRDLLVRLYAVPSYKVAAENK